MSKEKIGDWDRARARRIYENAYLADIELGVICGEVSFKQWLIKKGVDVRKLLELEKGV